jgi:1-acyl-sn-glycerol-3-phosphate acyltransferase
VPAAPGPERLRGLRLVTLLLLGTIVSGLAWFAALVTLPFEPRRAWWAARVASLWGRAMLVVAGARLRVEGAERFDAGRATLLVGNHASFLDPMVMLAVFPGSARFVLKRELGRVPFVGWHCKLSGHFLLDRASARAGQEVVDRAVDRARAHGLSLIVFPEGTRSADGRLQDLKAGAFQMALGGGLPVQPVALLGTHDVWPRGGTPRRSGEVLVRVGEPIDTEGLEGSVGRKRLADRTREALLSLGVPG